MKIAVIRAGFAGQKLKKRHQQAVARPQPRAGPLPFLVGLEGSHP